MNQPVGDEEGRKDDVDNDNWLRKYCFAIDAGPFLSWQWDCGDILFIDFMSDVEDDRFEA